MEDNKTLLIQSELLPDIKLWCNSIGVDIQVLFQIYILYLCDLQNRNEISTWFLDLWEGKIPPGAKFVKL